MAMVLIIKATYASVRWLEDDCCGGERSLRRNDDKDPSTRANREQKGTLPLIGTQPKSAHTDLVQPSDQYREPFIRKVTGWFRDMSFSMAAKDSMDGFK